MGRSFQEIPSQCPISRQLLVAVVLDDAALMYREHTIVALHVDQPMRRHKGPSTPEVVGRPKNEVGIGFGARSPRSAIQPP